jgi:hypothetical protein
MWHTDPPIPHGAVTSRLVYPFGWRLPLVVGKDLRADCREAQDKAGILPTKWTHRT